MSSMLPPDCRQVPLAEIHVAAQVRAHFDEAAIALLAQSMREVGLLQPIRLRLVEGKLVVTDGERRLRAARLLGWTSIAAFVDGEGMTDAEIVQRQLIANCQRDDLDPMEKAKAIDRLLREAKWTAAMVAERLGMSPASVSKLTALLLLPEDVQKAVTSGDVGASTAYEIAKERDPKERARLSAEAVAGRLTRARVTRRGQPPERTRPKRRPRRATPYVLLALGGGRSVRIAGPGLGPAEAAAWIEELLERARRQPSRGIDLATWARSLSQAEA